MESTEAAAGRAGTPPMSFTFGDGIDWQSQLAETLLYTELPFWLMIPPGRLSVLWSGTTFRLTIFESWIEVFANAILDSRFSRYYLGPHGFQPAEGAAEALKAGSLNLMSRPCKTVVRIDARAHEDAFLKPADDAPPRMHREQEAYWASLCEAHVPVLNELIQRYRLVTHDNFACEISPWDVPIWLLKQPTNVRNVVLFYYKTWDHKPLFQDRDQTEPSPLQLATIEEISLANSTDATPGEFELLDADSLMERGDYSGAVRRIVTAIEAVVAWALLRALEKKHGKTDAKMHLRLTENDFPGRLRQWRKLTKPTISQAEFDEFEKTRRLRNAIVHEGRRLVHGDRGAAQRAVDTGRWLYEKIEARPDKAKRRRITLVKRRVGSVALAPRFPVSLDPDGITVTPLV